MVPSSKQNKTKGALWLKQSSYFDKINEIAIFYLHELLVIIDGLPAANRLSLDIVWQSIVLQN